MQANSNAGDHDAGDAFCRITAGAGGIEAQAWAAMLKDMYSRWADSCGYRIEWLTVASERLKEGCSSAEFRVKGDHAYGRLRPEHGVHRLSRMSPYGSADKRQTSFAQVEVMPLGLLSAEPCVLDDADLRVDTFRSSGPGGQHRNKTDSAVRMVHIPTGVQASCDASRSQSRNREIAREILQAKLTYRQHQEAEAQIETLMGERPEASFGAQIRSYVLFPYQMVVDHRTGFKTPDADSVLAGDLGDLHEAWRHREISSANQSASSSDSASVSA